MNWVKTSERAPTTPGYYLVQSSADKMARVLWASPGAGWSDPDDCGYTPEIPGYWAEIPPLPKEKSLGDLVWEAALEIEPPDHRHVRCAMNSASRKAFHARPGYRSGDTHIAGMRIVIDNTLADGVVELLRA